MSRGTVLITGITGFTATHTALAFLEAGYTGKGTARSVVKPKVNDTSPSEALTFPTN
ncbi:hypothetical protein C8J57DRAFT_1522398 [Mycena rebaudengoi]|nr:hypothetical protein C8J57DRAFT_1523971 [Mycena rebaudengoi]KAJ7248426.1 hypothetical protein C8J57DRAFT_1522398 [Mycena rebaudengoi]